MNSQTKAAPLLKPIADSIDALFKQQFGPGIGFALLVFEFDDGRRKESGGCLDYISTAAREDMMNVLQELLESWKARAATTGAELIAAERRRQLEHEGWTLEHDCGHRFGELTKAACAYAVFACSKHDVRDEARASVPACWPWSAGDWKPGADNSTGSRIRELQKAGALIAAEIDRLASTVAKGPLS